ncbi:MAG: peptidase domain-containing ABC transporter [Bacteroidetes bacterium]|nr:MAG: peptidase domain-containing ABC transporter [Bacteroidota bacterium]
MKFFHQYDSMDCGPSCLRMIADHYGKSFSLQYLRDHSYIDREGVSARGIVEAAEHIGMRCLVAKLTLHGENEASPGLLKAPLPCIVHWKQNHFVVVYKVSRKNIWIADPAVGKLKVSHREFLKNWIADGNTGVVILLEPGPEFLDTDEVKQERKGFRFLFSYLKPFRQTLVYLLMALLLGGLFQLAFPFLTQAIVDIGIANYDLDFIYIVLLGLIMLFLGQTTVNLIQGWMLLHIGTRINVSLITDFLVKLLKLPIAYFDRKMTGDLLQRLGDHRRIEQFLTHFTLSLLFAMFNLVLFALVLLYYHVGIFMIFLVGAAVYLGWILIWLKKREEVDHRRFRELSENQEALIEIIQGVQEIKLQGSDRKHRRRWMNIQGRLFRANIRFLTISQYQDAGAAFISQFKDILITFFAARAVIYGQMTLGMMLAVQYIAGQLNGPLQQFVGFIRSAQDARLSMNRMREIHDQEPEPAGGLVTEIPENDDLIFSGVSFKYNALSDHVLEKINLVIPAGKVTAIVGASGSGKTTLVKLLLNFYTPETGKISYGNLALSQIDPVQWRSRCGAVLQDGFIFSDTIAGNISESSEEINWIKLQEAAKIANIDNFIHAMPLGFNTKIGDKGNGLSQGQRQRLVIARAVYKDPGILFFDEATNALDAENEKIILNNLRTFFENRTVVVVAHRLSTVKNADQIVVLDNGRLVEKGTHEELTVLKGTYYNLVKNQLELGS